VADETWAQTAARNTHDRDRDSDSDRQIDRQKERHKKYNENGEIEMSLNRNMPGRSQSRVPCLLPTRYFVPPGVSTRLVRHSEAVSG
jgi:hypothetical protein